MLRFPMISQWTCHRPKNSAQEEIFWSLSTSHSAVSQYWPMGRPPRSEHSNGTCDPWHARQWETGQIGGWARLHNVGGQKERWRAHCCHVLPRVCEHPQSLSRKAPLRIVR